MSLTNKKTKLAQSEEKRIIRESLALKKNLEKRKEQIKAREELRNENS